MLRKSVETRDWVNTIEPRNVRAVMKRVVEDTTSIDVQVVTPLLSLVTVPEDKLLFLRSILQKLKLKLTHTYRSRNQIWVIQISVIDHCFNTPMHCKVGVTLVTPRVTAYHKGTCAF